MRDYLVPVLSVLAMGLVVYAFIGDAACNAPPRPDAGPPPPDAAPPVDAYVIDAQPPPPPPVIDDDRLTLEEVRRIGLVGVPAVWIERSLEGDPVWSRDPSASAPTYTNDLGTRVTFKVRNGRVVGVGATFSERALSADLAILSSFVVGQHEALPLHFETYSLDTPVKPRGSFDDRFGRRWYYRVEMRRDGESPYGPAVFEIAPDPFPGQSPGLDPPPPPPGLGPPPDFGAP